MTTWGTSPGRCHFYAGGTGPTLVESSAAGLLGILWGGPSDDLTTTYYSTLMGIEKDLGLLKVCPGPNPFICWTPLGPAVSK